MKQFLPALLLLAACQGDETLTGYGGAGTWHLQAINDQPFTAAATLTLATDGTARGQAPCNSYSARQTAPYPWFALSPIASTKRACAALPQEHIYFETLRSMSLAEVAGPTLILSNDQGQLMQFTNQPAARGG